MDHEAVSIAKVRARYPLVVETVQIAGRAWRVEAVQNQDALLDAAEELNDFPYGLLLWEAAVGLARYLAANPLLVQGKHVLELGAGVGLPGIIAQELGAFVRQTDHQSDALVLAQLNARRNSVAGLSYLLADWREWKVTERFEVILGADILYERAIRFYLEEIFRTNLVPGGVLVLSDPGRPQALEFAAYLEAQGWRITIETTTVMLEEVENENKPVEVAILTCRAAR